LTDALGVGAISGLIGGVILGLETGQVVRLIWGRDGLAYALIYGIVSGLLIALVSGLYNGGRACIQHIILRVLLWQTKCIPWNYPRFLDYAAEQLLLRKVGGGYIFVHRLLLDYFSTLEALPISDEPTGKREERVPPVEASLAPTGPTAVGMPLEPLPPVLPESTRLLSCGHEQRLAARFCSVCGAPVAS
jgi:hypothetical protein